MEFSTLNLLLVLPAAWLAGTFATRLGYPAVLGELLVGIVLEPRPASYILKIENL